MEAGEPQIALQETPGLVVVEGQECEKGKRTIGRSAIEERSQRGLDGQRALASLRADNLLVIAFLVFVEQRFEPAAVARVIPEHNAGKQIGLATLELREGNVRAAH